METQQNPGQDELLDLEAAAERLCVSKTTLYRMLDRGEVKGIKVGRQWRFRPADLDAYLSRGPVATALAALPVEVLDHEIVAVAGKLAEDGAKLPQVDDEGLDQWEARAELLFLAIVRLGLARRANDIHFEAIDEEGTVEGLVRFRIDSVLHEAHRLPLRVHEAVLLRVRQMAGSDAENSGSYLDARLRRAIGGIVHDLRLSMMPTSLGEMLTLQLFNLAEMRHRGIDELGFHPDDLQHARQWMHEPYGLIMVNGPTGSGMTTLMYKLLLEVAGPQRKVASVEDPVEYRLSPWVTQVEINAKTHRFSHALRAIMRHDIDIFMVGELRDLETLDLSIYGAEAGHLVISPVHVPSVVDVVKRMVEVFPTEQWEQIRPMVAKLLTGIIGMRLIRILCDRCKEPAELPPDSYVRINSVAGQGGYMFPANAHFYCAVGCSACGNTGYRGRTGVYEVLEPNPAYRSAILQNASRNELLQIAVAGGMRTLAAEGIRKAAEGITSLEEVQPLIRQYEQMPAKE